MTIMERHTLEALRDPVLNNAADGHVGSDYKSDGYGEMVLDGTEALNVSHASGEFQELTRGLLGNFWKRSMAAFSIQMSVMAEAYMVWSFKHRGTGNKGFFDSDE
ncbi:hypothetical protein BKA83DRAFT_4059405 [Pisolithus microcarpus]|nr:hypothetical protein BKA83DRAFT_4059405 [Pisolithus microcarpus]